MCVRGVAQSGRGLDCSMFGQVLSSITSVLQSKKYAGVCCVSIFIATY